MRGILLCCNYVRFLSSYAFSIFAKEFFYPFRSGPPFIGTPFALTKTKTQIGFLKMDKGITQYKPPPEMRADMLGLIIDSCLRTQKGQGPTTFFAIFLFVVFSSQTGASCKEVHMGRHLKFGLPAPGRIRRSCQEFQVCKFDHNNRHYYRIKFSHTGFRWVSNRSKLKCPAFCSGK